MVLIKEAGNLQFVGKSLAMSADGLAKAAMSLSVGTAEIAAVFSVYRDPRRRGFFLTAARRFSLRGYLFASSLGASRRHLTRRQRPDSGTCGTWRTSVRPSCPGSLLDREAALSRASWASPRSRERTITLRVCKATSRQWWRRCPTRKPRPAAGMADFIGATREWPLPGHPPERLRPRI